MPRLKDRTRQIPFGMRFHLTPVNYHAAPFSSFTLIVNQLHAIIQANPALAQKHNWPTSFNAIADWVDEYNAAVCKTNHWRDYYVDTPSEVAASVPESGTQPEAHEKWPLWAKALKLVRKEGEAGVGDTIERLIGPKNSAAYQAWHLKTFGQQCKCKQRQVNYNAKYPYD